MSSPSVSATVKWGKESYAVALDPASCGADFKAQLFSLTGVPPERQKLMSKAWKGVLKDEQPFAACSALGDGPIIVTLMGSAEGVSKPAAAAVFVEDMPVDAAVRAGAALPVGLLNNQNTCYANSTLEALRFVPELSEALLAARERGGAAADALESMAEQRRIMAALMGQAAGGGGGGGAGAGAAGGAAVTSSLGRLLSQLDGARGAVLPMGFLSALRGAYPQFAEQGAGGGYKQHDSDEFYVSLMAALAGELRAPTASLPALRPPTGGSDAAPNVVDTLFGVELETTYTCAEAAGAEPAEVKREFQRKLVCNIEGGAGRATQVNSVNEGIMLALGGEVLKRSAALGRNADWARVSRLASLPKYLCVQFLRFYWKATPDSRDHAGVKCKMLRPVTFPADRLDLHDACSAPLQARLRALREKATGAYAPLAAGAAVAAPAAAAAAAPTATAMEEEDSDLAAALRLSMADAAAPAAAASSASSSSSSSSSSAAASSLSASTAALGYSLPEGFCGLYELFALVTHKGRSADSGHYIAWVRRSATGRRDAADAAKWLVFDDDTVGEVDTDYVLSHLKGGGDDHIAYLAFYRARAGT